MKDKKPLTPAQIKALQAEKDAKKLTGQIIIKR